MRKNVVKALTLLLSVSFCFHGMSVKAEEPEEKAETAMNLLSGADLKSFNNQDKISLETFENIELPQFDSNTIPSLLEYQADDGKEKNDEVKQLTAVNKDEENKEIVKPEDTGLRQLQIPQKLEVVIDPWEMDGRSQIYSEQYVIRNDGKEPGILTLSNLACRVSEQSRAIVTTNRSGLHDGDEKLIYMQMKFGNGDQIDLSEDGSSYQVELQPEEELSVCFEGEVNENASESWQDGDVTVTVVYSWDVKPALDDVDGKEEKTQEIESENKAEEEELEEDNGNTSQDAGVDTNNEEINENKEEQVDEEEQESEKVIEDEQVIEEEETIQPKEDEILEVIVLKEFKPTEFVIDKWESDEAGQIRSVQYLVRNEGETEGMFVLSNLLYSYGEQSEIAVPGEEEEVNGSESGAFHMKLLVEEEQVDDIQKVLEENLEESRYKVMLRPGEELKFRFVGEMDVTDSEEAQKGNIILKAVGSWNSEGEENIE